MLRTFQFHAGLMLLMPLILAVRGRCWRLFSVTIILAFICVWPDLRDSFSFGGREASDSDLKVLSVNLLFRNPKMGGLVEHVRSTQPDVIFIQEYSSASAAILRASLMETYPHLVEEPRLSPFGMAIYSKIPFVGPVQTELPLADGNDPQMRAVVRCKGQRIALYNIHLVPPGSLDYVTVGRSQLANLVDLLQDEELPVIIGGDFNFTQTSPQASELFNTAGLREAHQASGVGRGTTWPKLGFLQYIPGLRIDHFYFREPIQSVSCQTLSPFGSDHLPIVVRFSVSQ